jgi:D-glycero-D-manno-heptose 1,7-bisphosphate phosphatase
MKKRKVIFIDRDGVINKDPGGWTKYSYVTRWKDFRFLPGAKTAIKRLSKSGYTIAVISNQAGIGKGYYSLKRLKSITARMIKELNKVGGKIHRAYYCIHQSKDNCPCRKPKDGLLKRAERGLKVKIAGSYFIGDSVVDVEAGKKAKLKTVLVLSGKSSRRDIKGWALKPDHVVKNLEEAVSLILK